MLDWGHDWNDEEQMLFNVEETAVGEACSGFKGLKSEVASTREVKQLLMVASLLRVVKKVLQEAERPVGIPAL